MKPAVAELAALLGLVPVTWLTWLRVRGATRDRAYWWLAGAFGVSWVTDMAARWANPLLLSSAYPVSQAGVIAAVLLPRREAWLFVALLVWVGVATLQFSDLSGPDYLLRGVAWGGITWYAYARPALGRLRTCLLMAFGVGYLAWLGYVLAPGWTSWGVYQGVRAAGAGLFCWVVWKPLPMLRVVA